MSLCYLLVVFSGKFRARSLWFADCFPKITIGFCTHCILVLAGKQGHKEEFGWWDVSSRKGESSPSKFLTAEREEALRLYFMPICALSDRAMQPIPRLYFVLWVQSCDFKTNGNFGMTVVNSEMGMLYIISYTKLLKWTKTCFAYFRDLGIWQKITFCFSNYKT